jgi:hypothetical protein
VYALGSLGHDRGVFQNGIGDFQQQRSRMYGADVTVPLTNTVAFVGTLNPDFSNIEQDQTTIAPQEFQRRYNEYRPFFAQGADYVANLPAANVNSADLLFYSPNIGIFNRGLKLEGTQGLSQIGAINVIGNGFNDSVFGYTWNKPDNSLTLAVNGVNANHSGLRDNAFGYGVATSNPHSGVFTIAHLASDRGTLISAPRQANDEQVAIGIQNSRTFAILAYKDIGPQYNPVDGYVSLNDVRGPQALYQYTGAGGMRQIKSYILSVGGDRFVDGSGAAHHEPRAAGIQPAHERLTLLRQPVPRIFSTLRDPVQLPEAVLRVQRRYAGARRRKLFLGAVREQRPATGLSSADLSVDHETVRPLERFARV